MESCCCPGSLSGSRCRFLSSGISAREAHGFPLSLLPGCQCLAPAPQATGAGRRVHKETTEGLVWQSSAFRRLFGGVRSAPQTEPHGHTMGCPTPPPQQAEGASPWIPAASLQTGRNPGLSPRLALENATHRAGTPCPGGTRWLWGSPGANNSWHTARPHLSTSPPVCQPPPGSHGAQGTDSQAPASPTRALGQPPCARHCHANLGQDKPSSHSPKPVAATSTLSLKPVQELQPVPGAAAGHIPVAQPTLPETH